MLLYLIVDAAACGERGVVQTAREAANNGVSLIQLRDFTSHDSEYCETASAIMEAIKGTDADGKTTTRRALPVRFVPLTRDHGKISP